MEENKPGSNVAVLVSERYEDLNCGGVAPSQGEQKHMSHGTGGTLSVIR